MTTLTWNPTDRDRMIYRWVKFDGHKQSWVAGQLNLHQSTVSRILDRYERWIAHGGPAQQGALTRDERLRAQRYLTYERNEWIITSALRLAGEMERAIDTSKSNIKTYSSEPSREVEVRTEHSVIHRSGLANRYLRLAHRVGMDQFKLVEQHDLPALEPFTLDTNEYSQALADSRTGYQSDNSPFEAVPIDETTSDKSQIPNPQSELSNPPPPAPKPEPRNPSLIPPTHNQQPSESPLTPADKITSIQISPHKKPTLHAYGLPQNPPEPTDQLDSILDAATNQPLPPIRILPIHMPTANS